MPSRPSRTDTSPNCRPPYTTWETVSSSNSSPRLCILAIEAYSCAWKRRNLTADLRCIQCMVNSMTLDTLSNSYLFQAQAHSSIISLTVRPSSTEESVFSVPGVKLWPEERRYPNSMLKMGNGGGGGSGAFGAAGSSSGSGRQSVSIAASD